MEAEGGGRRTSFSTLKEPIYHNRLLAVDVQSGRVVWKIGGRGREVPAELREAYFLGPPLPLGNSLFALVEKKQDLNLVCLGGDRGDVLWSQHLVSPRDKILLEPSAPHPGPAPGLPRRLPDLPDALRGSHSRGRPVAPAGLGPDLSGAAPLVPGRAGRFSRACSGADLD